MKNNLLVVLMVAIALAIAVFAAGNSQQDLEAELNNLTQELVDANYSWSVSELNLNILKQVYVYLK